MKAMKYIYLVFSFLIMDLCSGVDEAPDVDKVLVLDKNNFQTVLDENDFVLVKFFAPGCGACISMAADYKQAAEIMLQTDSNIIIAKIDGIEESEIAKKHGVDGFPTIRLFRKGSKHLDYRGDRTAKHLVSWSIRRSGPPAVELETLKDTRDIIANNDVVTIGFFTDKSGEAAQTYLVAAEATESAVFAITFKKELLKDFKVKPGSILLFSSQYDNAVLFKKEFTRREIAKFVEIRSLPLVLEFTRENSIHIFASFIRTHLLLFLSKSDPNTEALLDDIRVVAKDFKDDILFTMIDTDNSEYKSLFDYVAVSEGDLPTVRIIHIEKRLHKYKSAHSDITANNIRSFVQDFFDDKLNQIFRSEVLPEDWNKDPIHVLVGNNFESIVMDSRKDVLVEFYAPWCSVCNEFAPIYELLGEHYATREDIIVAKIDATKNEFKNRVIQGLPTITLYTKSNEEIDYTGERTFEALVKFIESGGIIQDKGDEHSTDSEEEEDDDEPSLDAIKEEL